MEDHNPIDREKVVREFDQRARRHGNINAVLDAGMSDAVSRQNRLRDFLTRTSLVRLLKPARKDQVLDLGCGVGRLTWYLQPRVARIAGVDVSAEMLQVARDHSKGQTNIEFDKMEGSKIPFPDGSFHAVFTVWVLQHIGDDDLRELALEIYRVLKPGGRVVLLEQTQRVRKVLSDIHVQREVSDYLNVFAGAGFTLVNDKAVMRIPRYAMSLWNRYRKMPGVLMPLLSCLESYTVTFREKHVNYHTWGFVFRKEL